MIDIVKAANRAALCHGRNPADYKVIYDARNADWKRFVVAFSEFGLPIEQWPKDTDTAYQAQVRKRWPVLEHRDYQAVLYVHAASAEDKRPIAAQGRMWVLVDRKSGESLLVLDESEQTPEGNPGEDPPDLGYELSRCTRVELEFEPSTLGYFCPDNWALALLSDEEANRLKSLRSIVVRDRKAIEDFAFHDLTKGYYVGPSRGTIGVKNKIHCVGYSDNKPIVSFRIIGTIVCSDDGHEFRYSGGLPHLSALMADVWPFALRVNCAGHLSRLHSALQGMLEAKVFPPATQWCDAILRHDGQLNPSAWVTSNAFECPSARTCHYAMNPNCRADSPPDTVLLFETKAGWNQHGSLELFTFDNHDPKGGLVLLNDDTVKFIRTEEELKQLRWK